VQRQEQQGRESLSVFIVDRTVPGMTEELLGEVQRLLHEAARRVSSAGEPVRYLRCTYIPEEDRCLCLFEADNPAAVRRANETAQVPFRRISAAIEYWEPGTGAPPRGSR
jgi:uncharacterized protein DUF4242